MQVYFKDKTELFVYVDQGRKLVTFVSINGEFQTMLVSEAQKDKDLKVKLKTALDMLKQEDAK